MRWFLNYSTRKPFMQSIWKRRIKKMGHKKLVAKGKTKSYPKEMKIPKIDFSMDKSQI